MIEHHPVFIRRLDTLGVHHTSARRSEVPNPALPRPVDIVSKGEERIARARHPIQLARPRLSFLLGQRRRHGLELVFPLCFLTTLEDLPAHEQVDRVRFLSAFDAFLEREREDARVMTEPPKVGFTTREPGTVDTGLLTRPQTDNGTVFGIRDTVGLSVFQCERGDEQICQCLGRKLCRAAIMWSMTRVCGV